MSFFKRFSKSKAETPARIEKQSGDEQPIAATRPPAPQIRPDEAQKHLDLGVTYGQQGRLVEATREFQAALRVNPDLAEAHCNLGVAYGRQGCTDEAIQAYRAALRINPDDADAHYNLG